MWSKRVEVFDRLSKRFKAVKGSQMFRIVQAGGISNQNEWEVAYYANDMVIINKDSREFRRIIGSR